MNKKELKDFLLTDLIEEEFKRSYDKEVLKDLLKIDERDFAFSIRDRVESEFEEQSFDDYDIEGISHDWLKMKKDDLIDEYYEKIRD